MKGRESDMPEEAYWNCFFDAGALVDRMFEGTETPGHIIEFGCGYGTFTVPAAQRTTGIVTALDIEPEMVAHVSHKASEFGLPNIRAEVRDFVAQGTGVEAVSQTHAMIFNLLHLESPVSLLQEALRVLRPGGSLSVIHWRSDISTPRGPSLDIRPDPEQCRHWMEKAGFHTIKFQDVQGVAPFHFGLVARR